MTGPLVSTGSLSDDFADCGGEIHENSRRFTDKISACLAECVMSGYTTRYCVIKFENTQENLRKKAYIAKKNDKIRVSTAFFLDILIYV